jgi:hypothetical protein
LNALKLLSFFNPKSAFQNPKSCLNELFVQALYRSNRPTSKEDNREVHYEKVTLVSILGSGLKQMLNENRAISESLKSHNL